MNKKCLLICTIDSSVAYTLGKTITTESILQKKSDFVQTKPSKYLTGC